MPAPRESRGWSSRSWRIAREATLADLCAAFVDRRRAENLSPATVRYYRQTSERWLRFCAEQELSDPRDVAPDHPTAYAAWFQAGGNNKQSVATWLRGVRALMSWAELRGYIELSPFRLWKLKQQPKLPAQRGLRRKRGAAHGGPGRPPARQPAARHGDPLLLFDAGIRRSEVSRLRLADVIEGDHMASSVTVHGKGDKDRRMKDPPADPAGHL